MTGSKEEVDVDQNEKQEPEFVWISLAMPETGPGTKGPRVNEQLHRVMFGNPWIWCHLPGRLFSNNADINRLL